MLDEPVAGGKDGEIGGCCSYFMISVDEYRIYLGSFIATWSYSDELR